MFVAVVVEDVVVVVGVFEIVDRFEEDPPCLSISEKTKLFECVGSEEADKVRVAIVFKRFGAVRISGCECC